MVLLNIAWRMYTTVQKFAILYFILLLISLFSSQSLNWSIVTVKTFIMLQKVNILNKQQINEKYIHLYLSKNPEKIY